MLTITPTAAEAVRQLSSDAPAEGGLRIAPGPETPGGTSLQVTVAEGAEDTDQTIEEGGATVFVDSDAAEFLDDKVLDAAVDEAGRVRFSIAEGPPQT